VHGALLDWLQERQRIWPRTPNRHVLVSAVTATGTAPISDYYLSWHLLLRGVQLEQIRGDRVLHEALAVPADPLHLAAMFQLSTATAIANADIARSLLERSNGPSSRPGSINDSRAAWRPGRSYCSATGQSAQTGRDHDRQQLKGVGFVLTTVHSR
jgi:hypothetical protein